jgi:CelD/BcsL family acetyltransferase involved in cellulose biosynthesis
MIEDLHRDPAVTLLNFGMGDAEYKRRLADIETAESSWLIMRRSIRNRILVKSHSILNGTVDLVKKVVRRKKSP